MKARQFVQDSYSLGTERRKHSRKTQGKMRKAVHWIPVVLVVVLGTNNGGLDMMTKCLWTLLPIEINGVDRVFFR